MASAASKQPSRCRVSIVGLSGREKGRVGVGKSCLCNRFVRPNQNDFRADHISQLSNSDWMSLVINNQHFLYWGAVDKSVSSESDRVVSFELVEQTEFEDDSSFKPFGASGGNNNYLKRASQTKLVSSGKLMYINKDQLALPTDYTVENFPAKYVVDGFVVVADASKQHHRPADAQPNFLSKILPVLVKQKKPIVIAATKCDDVSEKFIEDLEVVVAKYKGVQLVRTSASEGINVEAPFFLLEQLVTQKSSRFVPRVPSFADAARLRQDQKDASRRIFEKFLKTKVTDFRVTWNRTQKILNGEDDFEQFVALAGTPAAKRVVLQYVKRLKGEKASEKLTAYQQLLPSVLQKVLALDAKGKTLLAETTTTWSEVKELLRDMAEFDRHFVVLADERHWDDDETLVSTDARIPADILDKDFAKNSFDSMRRKVQLQADQEEVANFLVSILEEYSDRLMPGMDWTTANQYLLDHPRYKTVPETVALPTYVEFEQKLRESCRAAFNELLLERIELFDALSNVKVPTSEHIATVESQLKNEPQYTRLEHCRGDRNTVIWNMIGARHKPLLNGDVCHAIGRLHSEKTWMLSDYKWYMAPTERRINIILLGMDQLAHELDKEIEGCKSDGFIRLSHNTDHQFDLNIRIINVSSVTADTFIDDEFAPQGLIGVFSSPESVEYLQRVLSGIMLHTPLQSALDPVPFRGLPCVLVNAVDHQKPEVDHLEVEKNGQRLAYRLQCPVISGRTKEEGKRVTALQAIESVGSLIDGIKHRHSSLYASVTPEPDLKIAVCCLAQDPIFAERVLGPFLRHQCCWRPSQSNSTYTDTLYLEMCFGRSVRIVQLKVYSSLSAEHITKDVKHGLMVIHCTARRASLNVARLLLSKLPAVPTALVSVPTSDSLDESSEEYSLLEQSKETATHCKAMSLVAGPSFQFDEVAFTDFLNEAWDRREASIQTQTAQPERPRCNTPPGLRRNRQSSSVRSHLTQPPPHVHKHAVFDDMELSLSSSIGFRSLGRPLSMTFDTPSRGSLDFTTDSGCDSEYTAVPGSNSTSTLPFTTTPGRTSPRPHIHKSSAPATSLGSGIEAIGSRSSKSSSRSLSGRALGAMSRARKSTSPSTTSVTSESGGSDLENTTGAELSNSDTFYAEPADAMVQKARASAGGHKDGPAARPMFSLPTRPGNRNASSVKSTSSAIGSPSLDAEEYTTPADAKLSLQKRTSGDSAVSGHSGYDKDDYANPWDTSPATRQTPSTANVSVEYMLPADMKHWGKSPPSPLVNKVSQADEYALPADVVKAKPRSPALRKTGVAHHTPPPASGTSEGGDVYAFPHDVLKPDPKKLMAEPRRASEPFVTSGPPSSFKAAAGNSATLPGNRSAPAPKPRSPKPKSWLSKSIRKPAPGAKPKQARRGSSPMLSPELSPRDSNQKEKSVTNPKEAFAAINKELSGRDCSSPSSSSKPRTAPKPKVDPRWSRPESAHQFDMVDVQSKLRGNDQAERSQLSKVQAASPRASPPSRLGHPSSERKTSRTSSAASSSCGSDSSPTSEDDMPKVSRGTLQRNESGIHDKSSLAAQVENLYAITAKQVGPNIPPSAPPLPEGLNSFDEQQVTNSLQDEIRRRRKNSLAKVRLYNNYLHDNQPLVNEDDSGEEAPPLPPKMYSLSESEGEEDESLSGSRVEISEASGEGLMSTLMRKAKLQIPKLTKEEKERRQVQRDQNREVKRRKTKKFKKEEQERLRREAHERYIQIFKSSLGESPTSGDDSLVPMFVEACVAYIEEHGITTEGLYRVSGNKLDVDQFRDLYAKEPGMVPECTDGRDIAVVTSALKSFFHMLAEPLIPTSIYSGLVEIVGCTGTSPAEKAAQLRDLLQSAMSPKEMAVLAFMVQHLNRVSQHEAQNKMTPRNLSIVFAPNFTALSLDSYSASLSTSLNQVVSTMISECAIVFGMPPNSVAAKSSDKSSSLKLPRRTEAYEVVGNLPVFGVALAASSQSSVAANPSSRLPQEEEPYDVVGQVSASPPPTARPLPSPRTVEAYAIVDQRASTAASPRVPLAYEMVTLENSPPGSQPSSQPSSVTRESGPSKAHSAPPEPPKSAPPGDLEYATSPLWGTN